SSIFGSVLASTSPLLLGTLYGSGGGAASSSGTLRSSRSLRSASLSGFASSCLPSLPSSSLSSPSPSPPSPSPSPSLSCSYSGGNVSGSSTFHSTFTASCSCPSRTSWLASHAGASIPSGTFRSTVL